jgi:hypothetical protein
MPRDRKSSKVFKGWMARLDALCRERVGAPLGEIQLDVRTDDLREYFRSGYTPDEYLREVVLLADEDEELGGAFDVKYEL